ncbi:MAG: 2-oxoglutarate oxidoreductase [Gemmatimonadetes bacterium]|nr:MAG: 2-oxoglutarate oxidoreductase [Gemmatimonadota bacterium]
MFGFQLDSIPELDHEYYRMEDYQSNIPRWCPGCGDSAILTAVQKLCRDEQLPPEKTVFVSGIGCSSRFPHYMKTYGFHGLHGRAFPIAQGIRIRRPDLHIFVNTGDGDCFSIGTAHWIHAVRMNMRMVVMVHDNNLYGLTKLQSSPTTPEGFKTNTTPRGAYMRALNPLTVTLGITNVSFVAQVAEWMPSLLAQLIEKAYHHPGFAFIRILQRCPAFAPTHFDPMITNPDRMEMLVHENGMVLDDTMARIYKRQIEHDPSNIHRARELAEDREHVPIGLLYHNPQVRQYCELRRPKHVMTIDRLRENLEAEFDKFSVVPQAEKVA